MEVLKAPSSCRTDRGRAIGGDRTVPWGRSGSQEILQSELMRNICSAVPVRTRNKMHNGATGGSQASELTNIQPAATTPPAPPLQPKVALSLRALPGPAGQRCSGVTIRTLQRELNGESESPRATGTQMSPHTAGWSQEDLVAQMGWQLGIWT